jgi:hypothetical protein
MTARDSEGASVALMTARDSVIASEQKNFAHEKPPDPLRDRGGLLRLTATINRRGEF